VTAPGFGAATGADGVTLAVVTDGVIEAHTGRQGRYAGIVSRTVSVVVDSIVLAIASIGSLFVVQAVLAMLEGVPFGDYTLDPEWGIVIVAAQAAIYFTAAWAVFGRTGGEALFGLRLVRRNGREVGWARAFLRFLLTPLAYAFCGLGFAWILIDNRRRTWADIAAGTVVIYDWRRADGHPAEGPPPHA
jgi:uncharacterized RDD family membrane protein YckC